MNIFINYIVIVVVLFERGDDNVGYIKTRALGSSGLDDVSGFKN